MNRKIFYNYRIIFFHILNNRDAKKHRDQRFKDRKAVVKIRPRLRLFSIEHWETSKESRKKINTLKTKSYIRIDLCPPGKIIIPARKWD